MTPSQIFIFIAILVLAGIMIARIVIWGKRQRPLTPLTGLAFAFIVGGIVFGENRLTGYGLMAVGVLLAVIDIIRKSK
jgi:hypothetical protein